MKAETAIKIKYNLMADLPIGHRLVQSHQQNSQRDMRGLDSRVLDDESKIIIQFELPSLKLIKYNKQRPAQSQQSTCPTESIFNVNR